MTTVKLTCTANGCDFKADHDAESLAQWNEMNMHYENVHMDTKGVTRLQVWWAQLEGMIAVIYESQDPDEVQQYKHMARGFSMCFRNYLPQAKNNNWTVERIGAHALEVYRARKAGESIPPTPGVNGGMRIEAGSNDVLVRLKEKAANLSSALNAGMTAQDLADMYKTTPDVIEKVVMDWTTSD